MNIQAQDHRPNFRWLFSLFFTSISPDGNRKWGEKDSNLRRHKSTDLQSVPVGHFGIPPSELFTITSRRRDFLRSLSLTQDELLVPT